MAANPTYILPLTALRGVAALCVMFMHIGPRLLPQAYERIGLYTGFVRWSYLWVDFFFLLSGFVLYRAYSDKWKEIGYSRFLFLRFSRIYPLHFFTLMFLFAFETARLAMGKEAFVGWMNIPEFFKNLFLLQSFNAHPIFVSWNGPAWSIGAEWVAYLVFPVICALVCSRFILGSLIVAIALLFWLQSQTAYGLDLSGYRGIARCLCEFLIGAFIASKAEYVEKFSSSVLLGLFALSTSLILLMMHLNEAELLVVCAMAILIVSLIGKEHSGHALLGKKWPMHIGKISYSIYLLHVPVMKLVAFGFFFLSGYSTGKEESSLVWFVLIAIVMVVTVVSAHFSYLWIEVRCRHWLTSRFESQMKNNIKQSG